MERFVFIFLDGVGLGQQNPTNPFYAEQTEYLPFFLDGPCLPDGTEIKAIDPVLDTPGIPQSASGQTSLYSGINVPGLTGQHHGGYPNRLMREILGRENLLLKLKKQGFSPCFLNAYPVYASLFKSPHVRILEDGQLLFSKEFPTLFKRRLSVTSCMSISCDFSPFDEQDIIAGKSVYQDYSNCSLINRGLKLPEFSPETAARIICSAARNYHLTLYEYFQTDVFGHRRDLDSQRQLISNLNRLIGEILRLLDPGHDTLLLTSDHGNLEDSSTTSHTINPVPLLAWGKHGSSLRQRIDDLTDVTPAIMNILNPFDLQANDV